MNKKIIYFSLLSLLLLFTVQDACARKKKEKSAKMEHIFYSISCQPMHPLAELVYPSASFDPCLAIPMDGICIFGAV